MKYMYLCSLSCASTTLNFLKQTVTYIACTKGRERSEGGIVYRKGEGNVLI